MTAQPDPNRRTLISVAFQRGDQPLRRGFDMTSQLIAEVAQWAQGTLLEVVLAVVAGQVRLAFTALGSPQPYWERGIRHHARQVVALTSRRTVPTPEGRLVELVRNPARAYPDVPSGDYVSERENEAHRVASLTGVPTTVWPAPQHEGGAGLLGALLLVPGSFVRILIGPAEPIEQWMVQSAMKSTYSRVDGWDFDFYLGTPVRLRTFIGAPGFVPATLKAAVTSWGTGLRAVDVDPDEARRLTSPTPELLAGHVVPAGMALSMLRIPAVGWVPQTGVASELPRPRPLPLDPVPSAPKQPIRLGAASTITGRRTGAVLDVSDLPRHGFVEGSTGAGKTTFIAELVAELSRAGIGFTYLDLHGSGLDACLRTANLAQEILVVRHSDTAHPVPVNFMGESDPERREQAITDFGLSIQQKDDPRGEGIVGPRFLRTWMLTAEGACEVFGSRANVVQVAAIMSDPERIRLLAKAVRGRNPDLANRLDSEIGGLSNSEATSLTSWAVSKFTPFTTSRAMRAILGTGLNAVNVDEVMTDHSGLLIDLGGPTLGAMQAQVLGTMWLQKHWLAMGRRRDRTHPHVIIVDEAHLFSYGALPHLLAEGRKFGIGVMLATQSIESLPAALQRAIEANVGTHLSLRLSSASAMRASQRFGGWPPEHFVRLPDLTAIASLNRGGAPTDPFTLQLDHYTRSKRLGRINPDAALATVETTSRSNLWEVYASASPRTDADTVAALKDAAQASSTVGQEEVSRTLDDWFEVQPQRDDSLAGRR